MSEERTKLAATFGDSSRDSLASEAERNEDREREAQVGISEAGIGDPPFDYWEPDYWARYAAWEKRSLANAETERRQ